MRSSKGGCEQTLTHTHTMSHSRCEREEVKEWMERQPRRRKKRGRRTDGDRESTDPAKAVALGVYSVAPEAPGVTLAAPLACNLTPLWRHTAPPHTDLFHVRKLFSDEMSNLIGFFEFKLDGNRVRISSKRGLRRIDRLIPVDAQVFKVKQVFLPLTVVNQTLNREKEEIKFSVFWK